MVSDKLAAYEPPKQDRSVLIYWRLPEEWVEILYEWVRTSRKYFLSFLESIKPQLGT
ncbi:hypothetical protein BT96DRAFT_921229 [Gymnopus androsaceus JB14]|uniref:Uncharacterized protein n=1 Tax=Gymnopus androsaceus JB14 TaxID=1447944 RepID=A0A6A4HL46_9AGAR|nr:hypothetical protein BT96DRAFT_921229 [Gymnopus androsaceus JB14]